MGILNATPDSFSDAGQHLSLDRALHHARQMISEGALIIDVGGESTRPGAPAVSAMEEHARVIPIISALRREWDGWISIDTSKASVAAAALDAGADIVNDVTGLRGDPKMATLCAEQHCAVVVMHMQGSPDTMQRNPQYGDVVAEVRAFFLEQYDTLIRAGIDHDQICFDPGIGFGKTPEHNWRLLHHLTDLIIHQRPLLLGLSRKSFIGHSLQSPDLQPRSWPTVALTALGRERGALIHRVHEVQANEQALRMTEALLFP
jgi:dihydropteroate synthase